MGSFAGQTGDGTREAYWREALRPHLSRIDNSSSQSSSDALESALRREESEILAALQTVRARINALLPITRLPPEIICLIILYHSQIDPFFVEDEEDDIRSASIGWIRSTHVCRRWRQIALAHSVLWSCIPLSLSPTCISTFLDRCKSAPLRLELHALRSKRAEGKRAEDFVMKNIHRAQSVQIIDWGMSLFTSVLPRMHDPAPFLEDFEFQDHSSKAQLQVLSADFLGGFTPRLRRLHFRSPSQFPWSSPLLVNLVSLTLRVPNMHIQDALPPPLLCEVLNALERMPALESLTLLHGLPRTDVSLSEDRIIHLPHLASLDLTVSSPGCTNLIRHLKIPANASVTMQLTYVGEAVTNFQTFFPVMSACLGLATTEIPAVTLAIVVPCCDTSLMLQVWRESHHSSKWTLGGPDLTFIFTVWSAEGGAFSDWDSIGLRRSICHAFSTGYLQTLLISDSGWKRQNWKELAQRAPNIWAIIPGGGSEHELCHALCEDFAGVGPHADYMFPRLADLEMDDKSMADQIPELSGVLPGVLAARAARRLQRTTDSAVSPGDQPNS
ncbi:hypothetical protein FA95DRAFT_1679051 [Auriscalpium vulgare]|uniref:Uncharacterized protein n=1 Tax=Auriscalpium vulgare TaxID=40419 RepID=A0ACB8RTR6_9AGAM|nr:hypothetical protein FA95DRAFT_1679051 [Auriscalpium vulgare]